ncbi:MAG: four helix bundle protein [Candidatus Saccharimonadales bacterium]
MEQRIKTYRDLKVWQKARELVLVSYRAAKLLPADEKYALTSQIKRAATSIPANIAEGFGRTASKDREHFYVIAQGSLYELDSHLQIARDLGFIDEVSHEATQKSLEETGKLLSAFIRTHRARSNL